VYNIVHGSSHPNPYVLFGPPGTGKTTTLVEAILQVWRQKPNSKIVVAAPSNTAADLLASKLMRHVPKEEILRPVSKRNCVLHI
jgi:superfamily I DNA and/or RNA helicase